MSGPFQSEFWKDSGWFFVITMTTLGGLWIGIHAERYIVSGREQRVGVHFSEPVRRPIQVRVIAAGSMTYSGKYHHTLEDTRTSVRRSVKMDYYNPVGDVFTYAGELPDDVQAAIDAVEIHQTRDNLTSLIDGFRQRAIEEELTAGDDETGDTLRGGGAMSKSSLKIKAGEVPNSNYDSLDVETKSMRIDLHYGQAAMVTVEHVAELMQVEIDDVGIRRTAVIDGQVFELVEEGQSIRAHRNELLAECKRFVEFEKGDGSCLLCGARGRCSDTCSVCNAEKAIAKAEGGAG